MKADSDPKLPPKERSGDPGTARTHADLPPIYADPATMPRALCCPALTDLMTWAFFVI